MKFRPCIDLHNGQVKQIVGSTLIDNNDNNKEEEEDLSSKKDDDSNPPPASLLATNFITDKKASEYAEMYCRDGLTGGHVIMLGPGNNDAAKSALAAYPGGLQIGGGINDKNALEWLDAGASHVIITSYVFTNGDINIKRLEQLCKKVGGKHRIVLDLSCRRKQVVGGGNDDPNSSPYYVMTDRWQKYTSFPVNKDTLTLLGNYCDEFLVHGVEVEGKRCGILEDLVILLGKYSPIPVTYAGGVRSMDDIELVNKLGEGKVDLTIGSALDCFGGDMRYKDVVAWHHRNNNRMNNK